MSRWSPEAREAMSLRMQGNSYGSSQKGIAKNSTGIIIPKTVTQRNANLKMHYGKSIAQYEYDLKAQGGECLICHRIPVGNEVLRYDHDHRCCSGRDSCEKCLRGLICNHCNRALGYFKDNIEILLNAVSYLRSYEK